MKITHLEPPGAMTGPVKARARELNLTGSRLAETKESAWAVPRRDQPGPGPCALLFIRRVSTRTDTVTPHRAAVPVLCSV